MVGSSSLAERRYSQEAEDVLLIKKCIGCDGECSAFISDGIAEERAPAARQLERDDEPRTTSMLTAVSQASWTPRGFDAA